MEHRGEFRKRGMGEGFETYFLREGVEGYGDH
jgi:hypothetical protein